MFRVFCRIEAKGKGILQRHQLILEFEAISEESRQKLSRGAFGEILRASQVVFSFSCSCSVIGIRFPGSVFPW